MRIFIGAVIVVGVIGGFLSHQKKAETVPAAPVTALAQVQPSPARPNYEHDWAKNSLDRAAEVRNQVAKQRKEDGNY